MEKSSCLFYKLIFSFRLQQVQTFDSPFLMSADSKYWWSSITIVVLLFLLTGCEKPEPRSGLSIVRVMTYNIEDVRTQNVRRTDHPRLQRAAARIQALAPEILLVNEMTYDQPGAPGYEAGDPKGQNARRFVENYLSVPQADTLEGQAYQTVMLPVNTGLPSGYDLNNDGRVVT